MIVYLARDIRPFVMYCVNGKLRSSLLIESTDSMTNYRSIKSCWKMTIYEDFESLENVEKLFYVLDNVLLTLPADSVYKNGVVEVSLLHV